MAELKPCPFCGCNAEIILTSMGMRGKCLICEAVGPPREFSELAAGCWNTRALDERVKELRDLLDDFPFFEEELEVLPMADDTFEEGDYSAIKKLAPSLPHVMCDDYDPYGGDSVSGALLALLTENGKVRIERISKIIETARKVAFPELFPAELKEKLKEQQ